MKENEVIIEMPMLEENGPLWRRVIAEQIGENAFRIISTDEHEDMESVGEEWVFHAGDIVRCELRTFVPQVGESDPHECLAAVNYVDSETPIPYYDRYL
ncbi:MAG: hypothetical protein IJS07_02510 [Bacteroidales bacterium]|nr:hypothetical protein [Bacteroidales bacterium]